MSFLEKIGNISATDYKAKVFLSTIHSISDSVWEKVQLDGEDFDPSWNFDTSTNYNFTAPVDGIYLAIGYLRFADNAIGADQFGASITKNGGTQNQKFANAAGQWASVYTIEFLQLSEGDTIALKAWQNTGAAQDLHSDTNLIIHLLSL